MKIIVVLMLLVAGFCSAQNDSTLLKEARKDALQDSLSIDRIKSKYIKALEINELSDIEQSATLKRTAYFGFVEILTTLENMGIPYPEYYAAASYQAGIIQLAAGNYSTAYSCFVTANKYSPKNIEYLGHLAYMNENLNDKEKNRIAIANYKELIKLDPKEPVYHLHLYYLYMSFGKYKDAKKELDTYTHTEGETPNSIQPYLNLYNAMGKPKKATEYLKGFIERNPAYKLEGELYLSRHLLSNEQNTEAFHYLMKNLDNLPTHDLKNLLNPYIQTYLDNKDTASVISFLDTLQLLHSEKIEVFQYSHDVRQSIGDTANILPVLQKMYELGKEDERVYQALAEYYQRNNMGEEFYRISAKGDSLFKTETWTYYHIISSFDTAQYERYINVATANVNRLTNKIAKSIAYTILAESYGELYKHNKVDSLRIKEFAAYDSALVYNPDNSEALNNYAYLLATSDSATETDLIRAERMAARAVKLDPSATHILDTYAWVLHLRDDNTTARIYINKLIRIAEGNSDKMTCTGYYHIYCILAPLNDPKAAEYLELLRKEYRKNPDSVKNDDKTREGIEKIL